MTELTPTELGRIREVLEANGTETAGPLTATLITGGRSNLTFRLDDGARAWVLRMPPRSGRTPSAHDVGREFRVTRALQGTPVPVAEAVVFCTDETVVGGPFAVAAFVSGASIQTEDDLLALDEPTRTAVMTELVRTLAALHRVDHVAAGLADFGRPDGYAQRQLRRWSGQWELVATPDAETTDAAAALIARLQQAMPDRQRSTGIVHGDYRVDNTLLKLGPTPRVLAVVDWELSTIGDPVADVAMMCAYRHPALDLILGSPTAWTAAALPSAEALAAEYEAAGGAPLEDWAFHLALARFKIAVIAAGIDHRRRAGSGSGPGFDTAGDAVLPFLWAGLEAAAEIRSTPIV